MGHGEYGRFQGESRDPDARDNFGQLPVDLPRFPGRLVPAVIVVAMIVAVG